MGGVLAFGGLQGIDVTPPDLESPGWEPVIVTMDINHQWIGLRENLQETIDFPIKYGVFPLNMRY